jgi:hypothetical protein
VDRSPDDNSFDDSDSTLTDRMDLRDDGDPDGGVVSDSDSDAFSDLDVSTDEDTNMDNDTDCDISSDTEGAADSDFDCQADDSSVTDLAVMPLDFVQRIFSGDEMTDLVGRIHIICCGLINSGYSAIFRILAGDQTSGCIASLG